MTTHIAFLRAVNLGQRRVSMARLVEIFEALGHRDVWTYINSGNVVFGAAGSRASLEQKIESALETEFGFEVTTFVRTTTELGRVLEVEPFPVAASDTYFVTFLKDVPSASTARALEASSNDYDTLVVEGREVYWRMHGKSSDTLLKKRDWNVVGEHGSTSRNITMLRKLATKLDQPST